MIEGPNFDRALRVTLGAFGKNLISLEEAAANLKRAHENDLEALAAALGDPAAKRRQYDRLWAKFIQLGGGRDAAGRAALSLFPDDPLRRETAERWLRRERQRKADMSASSAALRATSRS